MPTLTDIHIKLQDPEKSIAYPGPRLVDKDELPIINALLEKVRDIDRDEFMVQMGQEFWRGRHDRLVVDGEWVRLRKMLPEAPTLETLPSPLPKVIKNILLSPQLSRGGLVHVAGGPGCGKTTTASATLVSRLELFGGVAYGIEDPPELPLNGWHGRGYCAQTWVAGDSSADWMESMRGALRSQPTGTSLIMYVGEVRDPNTARAILRAAGNGFLVITTGFGNNIVTGIDTFFQLIGREYAASLASVLRVILYQHLDDEKRLAVQVLTSDSPASKVATIIRSCANSNQLSQLETEIMYQRNQIMHLTTEIANPEK
jgi:twitching motility protein PilT